MTLRKFVTENRPEIDAAMEADNPGIKPNDEGRMHAVLTTRWLHDLAEEAGVTFSEPYQGYFTP